MENVIKAKNKTAAIFFAVRFVLSGASRLREEPPLPDRKCDERVWGWRMLATRGWRGF